jgi:hypothetical protein
MTLLVQIIMVGLVFFLVGFVMGRDTRRPTNMEEVQRYIKRQMPDVWAAYHNGIREGYAQGLRDGQELQ